MATYNRTSSGGGTVGHPSAALQPYVMTGGGPNNESLLYLLYLYRTAFSLDFEMGLASAMAWLIFMFIAALSYFVFKTSKHWVYYEAK